MICYKCKRHKSSLHRTTPIGTSCSNWICDDCLHGVPVTNLIPTCKGDTYADRVQYQLDEWVKGNSIHNTTDEECCPDFSCCKPELQQPEEIRKLFYHGNNDVREMLLCTFLGEITPLNTVIFNGNTEITTPNN